MLRYTGLCFGFSGLIAITEAKLNRGVRRELNPHQAAAEQFNLDYHCLGIVDASQLVAGLGVADLFDVCVHSEASFVIFVPEYPTEGSIMYKNSLVIV